MLRKKPNMSTSTIRKWWITHQLDKSDKRDQNIEDEEEERRRLCMNLNQALRTTQLLIDFDGGRPILRLTAPLDLVNFPSVCYPRWPIECEVISDIIHHIEWDPPEPEPFYQHTGQEKTPMQVGEELGKVVFCTDHANKRTYFTCSRVRGSKGPVKSATCDVGQSDFTLEFESRFESGNLQKAVQVGDYDYELTLRTDLYTRKHTQWFYFRVKNMRAGVMYRFTIINLMKSSSLYSQGMKPLLYSEMAARDGGVGWQRIGSNIRYYRNLNQYIKDINSDPINLYSLTWTFQFPYDSDTCYLAHSYPYTYSRLQDYLQRISSNPAVTSYCKLRVLCHSLAGNPVYVMTITSHSVSRVEARSRKAVVVTARVHPGETNGSWMMEGFLDFLLGDSEDAQLLRDSFVFKVVPMLNPDGVVVGNYRCSLAGRDLNRMYKTMLRHCFPSVWHTRNMVERLMAERDVILYCDFHGHNRKNNVFMYGCNNKGDAALRLHERIFPLMMSKNIRDKFSFKSCKFHIQKKKEGTGRIAMWKLGIKNSYTMEATFGGSTLGDRKGTHFNTRDLKSLGFYFCDTLLDYYDPNPAKVTYCLTELAVLLRKQAAEKLGKDLTSDCNFSVSDLETSTSGSNSSDSDGPPVHLLNQPQTANEEKTPEKLKKKLKSYKERDRLRLQREIDSHRKQTSLKEKKKQLKGHQDMKGKNDTHPNVLQSTKTNIDSSPPQEDSVNESIHEQPAGRFRGKWQMNTLVKKGAMLPVKIHSGELSKVTLWQGCEPLKEDSTESERMSHLHHRTEARRHYSSFINTDAVGMDTQQWRCSALHLSPQLVALPHFLLPSQQRTQKGPRPSILSPKAHRDLQPSLPPPQRSLPTCIQKIQDIPQLSSFTSDRLKSRHAFRERDSGLHISQEDSSHADAKKQNDVTEAKCKENQTDITCDTHLRDADSNVSFFVAVQRSKDLQGKELLKENVADKRSTGAFLPVTKSSSLMVLKVSHPQTDTIRKLQPKELRRNHSRPCCTNTNIQGAVGMRSTQSAPSKKNHKKISV